MSWKQIWKEAWQDSTFVRFYRSRRLFRTFILGWVLLAFAVVNVPFLSLPGIWAPLLLAIPWIGMVGGLLMVVSLIIFSITDVWRDIREMRRPGIGRKKRT